MCRWLAYSGSPRADRGAALQAEALADRPEPPLPARRRDDERRRVRHRLVRRRGDARRLPQRRAGLERPQPARTRGAHRSRRSCSPTSAPPPGRRSSRRTAIRSGTAAGCGCTTASIREFHEVKRDLVLAVDPSLYPTIEGSTDSEVFFFLALTLGLEDDPPASGRARGRADRGHGRRHGVEHPIQMTVATTDGDERLGVPVLERGQLALALLLDEVETLRDQHPDNPVLHELSDETRLVVSEPLGDLAGRVERGARVELRRHPAGQDELHPFAPIPPGSPGRSRGSGRGCSLLRFGLLRSLGRDRDHGRAEERNSETAVRDDLV